MGGGQWLIYWLGFWWPVYILAFFPQMGYFPLTGISLLEMDQIATVVAISIVALIRSIRPFWKPISDRSCFPALLGLPISFLWVPCQVALSWELYRYIHAVRQSSIKSP
ncbi:hypothetical protein C8J57DRAFT_1308170 [Mycena rebaudengoi]|nr:hypothetical protein C8J57DRAFT_1331829 [Mycena rebaudengoi]KAJ7277893.1 hypothetical protein C8J57DRAFT_1308170 [Mycena rebaudengoi]